MSADSEPPTPATPTAVVEKRNTTRVGRYRLAFELASGGMATVYMARVESSTGFDKVVALKRIHPHLAREAQYVEMFLDEARLASRIEHPNVCGVIDFGEEDGEYFIVMEYLVGVPLSRLLAAMRRADPKSVGPRWSAIACKLIADACEGLHAAHELRDGTGKLLDVVHRDVSPQNLYVGFDGSVRVVDFGIAKAADKLHKTATGHLKGKFAYMAPEQIRQQGVDRRTDVWALGVILWEMLSLKRLFRRKAEVDTMYAVLEEPIVPPGLHRALPKHLDDIVLAALARDPAARTRDARSLGRELTRFWGRQAVDPVDGAEVGQLLHQMFPGEEQRQRNLVELARADEDEIPRVNAGSNPDDDSLSLDHTLVDPPSSGGAAPPRRSRALLLSVLGLVAATGLVGLAFLWGSMAGDPAGASLIANEPAPDPPAPAAETDPAPERPADVVPPPEPVAEPPEPADEPADVPGEATPGPARPARPTRPGRTKAAPAPEVTTVAPPTPMEPTMEPGPTPDTPGRLVVVVPGGWANVYDAAGRLLGPTPLSVSMPPGRHQLSLRFGGEPPPVPVTVEVPAGGVGRVSRRAPER